LIKVWNSLSGASAFNAHIKLQESIEPLIIAEKISLPQKANRGEKLLLKNIKN
jgi:hypothetical protein